MDHIHCDSASVVATSIRSDPNFQELSSSSGAKTSLVSCPSNRLISNEASSQKIRSSPLDKRKSIPGVSYILILVIKTETSKERTIQYDCVLCNTLEAQFLNGEDFKSHLRSRRHLLNILKVDNLQLYEKCMEDGTVSEAYLITAVLKHQSDSEKIIVTSLNYDEKRTALVAKILQLRSTSGMVSEQVYEESTSEHKTVEFEKRDQEQISSPDRGVMYTSERTFRRASSSKEREFKTISTLEQRCSGNTSSFKLYELARNSPSEQKVQKEQKVTADLSELTEPMEIDSERTSDFKNDWESKSPIEQDQKRTLSPELKRTPNPEQERRSTFEQREIIGPYMQTELESSSEPRLYNRSSEPREWERNLSEPKERERTSTSEHKRTSSSEQRMEILTHYEPEQLDIRSFEQSEWGKISESRERETRFSEPLERETRFSEPLERETRFSEPLERETRFSEPLERETRFSEPLERETRFSEPLERETRFSEPLERETRFSETLERERSPEPGELERMSSTKPRQERTSSMERRTQKRPHESTSSRNRSEVTSKRMKLLVVGDSEAFVFEQGKSWIENKFQLEITVDSVKGRSLTEVPLQLSKIFTPDIDIVFVTGLTCMTWKREFINSRSTSLWTLLPDYKFNLRDVPVIMNNIVRTCKIINPLTFVYLLIPSTKNIYMYNKLRVDRLQLDSFSSWLGNHPKLTQRELAKSAREVSRLLFSLASEDYFWTQKRCLHINDAFRLYYKETRPSERVTYFLFQKGLIDNFESSLISDGLNYTTLMTQYFFRAHFRRLGWLKKQPERTLQFRTLIATRVPVDSGVRIAPLGKGEAPQVIELPQQRSMNTNNVEVKRFHLTEENSSLAVILPSTSKDVATLVVPNPLENILLQNKRDALYSKYGSQRTHQKLDLEKYLRLNEAQTSKEQIELIEYNQLLLEELKNEIPEKP